MKKENIKEVKFQASNLIEAMIRNINHNFISISFQIYNDEDIHIKIVLIEKTVVEQEYVEDILSEFDAAQLEDKKMEFIIAVGGGNAPLEQVVYQRGY